MSIARYLRLDSSHICVALGSVTERRGALYASIVLFCCNDRPDGVARTLARAFCVNQEAS